MTLDDKRVLVDCGPMRMTIEAYEGLIPRTDLCVKAAKRSIDFLSEVASFRGVIKLPHSRILIPPKSGVPFRMWEAVSIVGDTDLTPMAAVAGTIADETANFLTELGASNIIVNNGGDLAVRLNAGKNINVGIRSNVSCQRISHVISVSCQSGIRGICTSGIGGRSFTRGVAEAVTVVAQSAAIADAAATAIANSTFIPHQSIIRLPADKIDPETDLESLEVTHEVNNLPEEFIERSLSKGISKASFLAENGMIIGTVITIKGRTVISEQIKDIVSVMKS